MDKLKQFFNEFMPTRPKVVDAACAFVWFHHISTGSDVNIDHLKTYFRKAGMSDFNNSRLRNDLRASTLVVKGGADGSFRPKNAFASVMEKAYPFVVEKSEDVITDDTVIPDSLVASTRGYIVQISKQINASYNNNIFDGCAVLMRRLLEILLIHSYQAVNREAEIQENDGYKNLSYIINATLSNRPFSLLKGTSEMLDTFREVGNFSAHGITYICRRKDIDNIRIQYRASIEELLYSAKLKK